MIRRAGSRRAPIAALVLAITMLAGACASSGFQYIKNSEDNAYFKVPNDWKVFDQDAVLERNGELSERQLAILRENSWEVRFDASSDPKLAHFRRLELSDPFGIAHVDALAPDNADQISLAVLRNYQFEIDTAVDEGTGVVLEYEPLEFDGGFHGVHLVAEVVLNDRTYTLNHSAVIDQSTSRLYGLLVVCSATCYEDHERDINRIVDSWTVEE